MPDTVTIGEARINDLDAIIGVMDDAFDPRHGEAWSADQCRATFNLPGYRWRIASCGDLVVGFLLSRTVAGESEMMLLAVAVDHRRAGVGRALIEAWLSECRTARVERVFLEVRDGNSALEFYRRFGFVGIARRKAYYSSGVNERNDAITMTLRLD